MPKYDFSKVVVTVGGKPMRFISYKATRHQWRPTLGLLTKDRVVPRWYCKRCNAVAESEARPDLPNCPGSRDD